MMFIAFGTGALFLSRRLRRPPLPKFAKRPGISTLPFLQLACTKFKFSLIFRSGFPPRRASSIAHTVSNNYIAVILAAKPHQQIVLAPALCCEEINSIQPEREVFSWYAYVHHHLCCNLYLHIYMHPLLISTFHHPTMQASCGS